MSDATDRDDFAELTQMLGRAEAEATHAAERASSPESLAASRRRHIRRRVTGLVVALCVVVAAGIYVPLTLLAPTPEVTATMEAFQVLQPAAAKITLPGLGAAAVSLSGAESFEGTVGTDGILAAMGGNEPRSIASISKLITALVILDAKPLALGESGPTLTFSKANAELYDKYYVMQATVQPMKAGSTMSQRGVLDLMLIVSASNYADVLSTWAFGSASNFRAAASAWLAKNGLTNTTIVEPTGLNPRNVSTPTDLIALARIALAHPVVAEIVASPSMMGPRGTALSNSNELLGVDGIIGLKTGTLEEAGSCLLFSAIIDVGASAPLSVTGVVLGGYNDTSVNSSVRELLASVTAGFHDVALVEEGSELGYFTTPWGEKALVTAGSGASILTWSDTPIQSTIAMDALGATANRASVGRLSFTAGDETAEVPLLLRGAIEGPDAWWRLTHPREMLAG